MSATNDHLEAFEFDDPATKPWETGSGLLDATPDPPVSDSPGTDLAVQELPADPLDQSSELGANTTALSSEPTALRGNYRTNPVPGLTDEKRMIEFLNRCRRLAPETMENRLVLESLPLMLWKFREYAITGDYNKARAVQLWIDWARKILDRPTPKKKDPGVSSGALFDASLTKGQVAEVQRNPEKPTEDSRKRPRSKPFSQAGEFIGKIGAKGKK